jgi:hypothetical protein
MGEECLAESHGPSLHHGTHICRTSSPHDRHHCAVCGYGWDCAHNCRFEYCTARTGECEHPE